MPTPHPAIGLSEYNPHLVSPEAQPPAFAPWRDRLAALHPSYFRIYVEWTRSGADLAAPQDGCQRGAPPCAAYAGLKDQLRALAARQLLEPGRWKGLLTFYYAPDAVAQPPSGCELPATQPRARPITASGVVAYQTFISAVLGLARQTGAQISYLSPWNEPNGPSFISPQRAVCSPGSPSLSPGVYATLVSAAEQVLAHEPQRPKLMLGELAGYHLPSPRSTTVSEFVAGLPDTVACAGAVWSIHDYAEPDQASPDAVGNLEQALDARPCTKGKPIFVTETGAGGVKPGRPRDPADPGQPAAACRAEEAKLAHWAADPRVVAAFQYSFREDQAYPTGLADSALTRTWPTYDLFRAWADTGKDPGPAPCG